MEGILLTGEEDEAEYTDDSGIRFDIQGALVGKIIKISKSKLSGSWSFTCPHCGRENGIDTNDLRIALGEKINKVARYQKVGNASKKLNEAKDFLSLNIERARVLKEHEDIIDGMTKSGSALAEMRCHFCRKTVPLSISATATSEVATSIIPTVTGVLLSEQFKEEVDFQVFEDDTPETMRALLEAEILANLLNTMPLLFERHEKLTYRIRWETKDKTAKENAASFTHRIQSLRHDIENAEKAQAEAVKALESTLINAFETDQARELGFNAISKITLNSGRSLRRKLKRLLLQNIAWLSDEIQYVVGQGGNVD